MGGSQSYPGLTQDVLEDYRTLTYLQKGEILYLMKKVYSIDPEKITANYHHRFSKDEILKKFDVLRVIVYGTLYGNVILPTANNVCIVLQEGTAKTNPFQDRIFSVFSSRKDECFSFEDLLDLFSAMSSECPIEVKAEWAFRIFDLDEDSQISARDISGIIDRLTEDHNNKRNFIEINSKKKIADIILNEMKLDNAGSMGLSEFKIVVSKMSEFQTSFYFRI